MTLLVPRRRVGGANLASREVQGLGLEVVLRHLVDLVTREPAAVFTVSAFRKPYVLAFSGRRARFA